MTENLFISYFLFGSSLLLLAASLVQTFKSRSKVALPENQSSTKKDTLSDDQESTQLANQAHEIRKLVENLNAAIKKHERICNKTSSYRKHKSA